MPCGNWPVPQHRSCLCTSGKKKKKINNKSVSHGSHGTATLPNAKTSQNNQQHHHDNGTQCLPWHASFSLAMSKWQTEGSKGQASAPQKFMQDTGAPRGTAAGSGKCLCKQGEGLVRPPFPPLAPGPLFGLIPHRAHVRHTQRPTVASDNTHAASGPLSSAGANTRQLRLLGGWEGVHFLLSHPNTSPLWPSLTHLALDPRPFRKWGL